MAKYDLDLRMGIDSRLQSADLDVGALSYSVDKHNLYIDALKEDKITIERQLIDSNRAYQLKGLDEQIYLTHGIGLASMNSGKSISEPLSKTIVKLNRKEGYVDASYNYEIISGTINSSKRYKLKFPWEGKDLYFQISLINDYIYIQNFSVQYYSVDPNIEYELIEYSYVGALGDYSVALGFNTTADGIASLSAGNNTVAEAECSVAFGKYNKIRNNYGQPYLFSLGIGSSNSNRANAFSVDYEGNTEIQNNLIVNQTIDVPELFHDGTSIQLGDESGPGVIIKTDLIVMGEIQAENGKILNNLETTNLFVKDGIMTDELVTLTANISDKLTVLGQTILTEDSYIINSNHDYEKIASETYVTNKLDEAKEEIMEDVREIADSIITDVWYRSSTPPTTVKQAKLLWIRYDGTSTYGNGVLYYFNPTLLNDKLTDAQVKLESNWIPMSAIYS